VRIEIDFAFQFQMGLLFVLIFSQIDFVIGAFWGPLEEVEQAKGFVGLSGEFVFQGEARRQALIHFLQLRHLKATGDLIIAKLTAFNMTSSQFLPSFSLP
jgi:hypothetical protein